MESQAQNLDAKQANGEASHVHLNEVPSTDVSDIEWLKNKKPESSGLSTIPLWAWALLFSSLIVAVVMGWMAWQHHQSLGVEKIVTKAISSDSNRIASGVVIKPSDITSALPQLDPLVAEQIEKAQAAVVQENAASELALVASAPLAKVELADPSPSLDTAETLVLKISPSLRLMPASGIQP